MGLLEPQRRWGTQGRQNAGVPHIVPLPTEGVRTGAGGGGTKTHPPPEKLGSNRPMTAIARRDKAQQRRQTQRWRQRREPVAQGTFLNTPPTQLPPQPKTTRTRVMSTTKRSRRRLWEAKPVQGLRQRRTAIGPKETARGPSGRRGGIKTPVERARSENRTTERRRRGPPLTVTRA